MKVTVYTVRVSRDDEPSQVVPFSDIYGTESEAIEVRDILALAAKAFSNVKYSVGEHEVEVPAGEIEAPRGWSEVEA